MNGYLGEALLGIVLLTAVISIACMLKKSSTRLSDTDPKPSDQGRKPSSTGKRKSGLTDSARSSDQMNHKKSAQTEYSDSSN